VKNIYAIIQLNEHGFDILNSKNMQLEKTFIQHGRLSTYNHSLFVAYMSLCIAGKLRIKINERSLVRGALLHDYFLYDWHIPSTENRRHAFDHPRRAWENASQDFELTECEKDIILKHMFPLTLKLPKYRESYIVLLADKYCAIYETLAWKRTKRKLSFLEDYLGKQTIIS